MTATYDCIATTTLGSDTATVTFSSISGSYTDLIIIGNFGIDSSRYLYLRVNSDTGSNYSTTDVYGNGTSALSQRESNGARIWIQLSNAATTSIDSTCIINVQNYSNTTTYKTILSRAGTASTGTAANVGLWRSTAAITSIEVGGFGGGSAWNLKSGSTFALYGVKAE